MRAVYPLQCAPLSGGFILIAPKTFLVIVAGFMAFAYVTKPFMPLPYEIVSQIDRAALTVVEAMHPRSTMTDNECASDWSGSDC